MTSVQRTGAGTAEDPYKITVDGESFVPGLTVEQYQYLLNPLRSTRVATRQASGKNLSYLESWDVRAHLSRIFGFANWDLEMVDYGYQGSQSYTNRDNKPMVEVIWHARMRLTIYDQNRHLLATYCEAAVGSATGGAEGAGIGDLHDNALKSAASDALKRCAINLGTQFGLSLYDNGSKNDVVRQTLVKPEGAGEQKAPSGDQAKNLEQGVGVTPTGEATNEGAVDAKAADEDAAGMPGQQEVGS